MASLYHRAKGKLKGILWFTDSVKAPGWPCLFKDTLDFSQWVWDTSQGAKNLDIGFLAMAFVLRAVCDVPQMMTIWDILLGPW